MLLLLAGCPSPPDSDEAWIVLGQGLSAYEELEDGDVLELVAGPQGGWHVDMAVSLGGFDPEGKLLQYRGMDAGTDVVVSYVTEALLYANRLVADGDGWERSGDRIVFDIASEDEVVGRELRLEVQSAQLELSSHRTVTIVDEQ